jgi:hypothetical protein
VLHEFFTVWVTASSSQSSTGKLLEFYREGNRGSEKLDAWLKGLYWEERTWDSHPHWMDSPSDVFRTVSANYAFYHLQMFACNLSIHYAPTHSRTHALTQAQGFWIRTFWVLVISANSVFMHILQVTVLCWCTWKSLQVTALASSKVNESRGAFLLGKEENRLQRERSDA